MNSNALSTDPISKVGLDSERHVERLPAAPDAPWRSISTGKLAGALAKAQAEIQNAEKDKNNPFFKSKYADLASVWDACRIPLAKNELAVVQPLRVDPGGRILLLTELIHSSGEWVSSQVPVIPVKNDPQGIGSAITYMRRFALSALVGVAPAEKATEDDVDDDDDGNAASGRQVIGPRPGPKPGPVPSDDKLPPAAGGQNVQVITDKQRTMLFTMLPSCKTSEVQLRDYLKDHMNVTSTKLIPIRHFENLLRALNEGFVNKTNAPDAAPIVFLDDKGKSWFKEPKPGLSDPRMVK